MSRKRNLARTAQQSRTASLWAVVVCMAAASPCYAQAWPTSKPSSAVDSVPKGLEAPTATEGYRAHQAGDHATAIAKLEAARKTDASGAVLAWLGYAYAANGQPVRALEVLEQALAAADKPLEPKQQSAATAKRDEVRGQVATVAISSRVSGATVAIDGGAPQPLPIAGLRMSSGEHTFNVAAAGHEPVESKVNLAGGGRAQLELSPTAAPPPPPAPAPPPPPPPPSPDKNQGRVLETIGIGTAVFGALAAGVGVATLINARSLRESTVDDQLSHEARFGPDCSLGEYSDCYVSGLAINEDVDRADNLETLGLVMTIAGGTFLVGGMVLYGIAPQMSGGSDRAQAPSIQCGPFGIGGIGCKGKF